MTQKQFERISKLLETYLDKFLEDAINAGVDISTKDFGKVLDREKRRIIENNGFTIAEFEAMEESQSGKDLAGSMEGMAGLLNKEGKKQLEKVIEDFNKRINEIDRQISATLKGFQLLPYSIDYKNILNAPDIGKKIKELSPKQFKQEDIKNLKPSQIQDYENALNNLDNLKAMAEELRRELQAVLDSLPASHSQLKGIGPNDHHPQLHTIESHIGVKITTDQLNKLASGENADELHTHSSKAVGGFMGGGGIPVPFFADEEVPVGTINGVNKTFTLANSPVPAKSLQVKLNGAYQTSGGVDFTLSKKTITFVNAPPTGSGLVAHYRYE